MIHFDCHAHIYEKTSAVQGARYKPVKPAPLKLWTEHLDSVDLSGGVIVQVSFLGTDNSELCNALHHLPRPHFAGVAVVDLDVADEELDRLASSGIKGFRWNLVRGAEIPDLKNTRARAFLERIYARDMHIDIHLESPRLAGFIVPLLDMGGVVVVDHMGLPSHNDPEKDPWLMAIEQLGYQPSRLYVKLSATYRTSFDTQAHARRIQNLLPADRLVWGSDWPHTQHEKEVEFQHLASNRHRLPFDCDLTAAQTLYGLNIC